MFFYNLCKLRFNRRCVRFNTIGIINTLLYSIINKIKNFEIKKLINKNKTPESRWGQINTCLYVLVVGYLF